MKVGEVSNEGKCIYFLALRQNFLFVCGTIKYLISTIDIIK